MIARWSTDSAVVSSLEISARGRSRRPSPASALCVSLGLLAWLASACASPSGRPPGSAGIGRKPPAGDVAAGREKPWRQQTLPPTVRVRISAKGASRIVTLPLDEYVLGAVRAEVLPSTLRAEPASRALDVQAIVSRTYAAANLGRHAAEGYDLCDTTHCQVYRAAASGEGPSDAAARAVKATRGTILTYQGRVIQALFHADCGGHTASAADVWGGTDAPYLQAVEDRFCTRSTASNWTYTVEESGLLRALNADGRTRIGSRFRRVEIGSRDASGRALSVTLVGSTTISVRAEVFRAVLSQAFGPRSIRSTWFDVARDGSRLRFSGVGFGHGVGLCQGGALRLAEARQTPADILAHYFPGTRVQLAATEPAPQPVAALLFGR
jgi:stage II sporulation protein D